jgi:carbonic anhydrase
MLSKNVSLKLLFANIIVLLITACSSNSPSIHADDAAFEKDSSLLKRSARPVHWGYEGGEGPIKWGSLSPVYALCAEGDGQSPINIFDAQVTGTQELKIDYGATALKIAFNQHVEDIIDNGHTIQVNVDPGSTITFGDKVYNLKQFHFHAPSEHTINGVHMPLEVHFVHQSDDGSMAVLGVLLKEGAPNPNFASIIANLPTIKGESRHLEDEMLSLDLHLPENNSVYFYMGSLTTPPCSENVQWVVLRDHPTISADQAKTISSVIGPNNRPVQKLNNRQIHTGEIFESSVD